MKYPSRWWFFYSSGLRYRAERYLFLIVICGLTIAIPKPLWLADYQDQMDGRHEHNRRA